MVDNCEVQCLSWTSICTMVKDGQSHQLIKEVISLSENPNTTQTDSSAIGNLMTRWKVGSIIGCRDTHNLVFQQELRSVDIARSNKPTCHSIIWKWDSMKGILISSHLFMIVSRWWLYNASVLQITQFKCYICRGWYCHLSGKSLNQGNKYCLTVFYCLSFWI